MSCTTSTLVSQGHPQDAYGFSENRLPGWVAAYTSPRHEKRIADYLDGRALENFLPLYRAQHRWKNGCKVDVELPLFPGYVFVHIFRQERARVLEVPGVLSIVGCGNEPAPLPDFEIDSLRTNIESGKIEPHPYLVVGERVRIRHGAMEGMEGILVRKKNGFRVVLTLDLIMRSMAVEVDAADVEPILSRSHLRSMALASL